MDHLFNKTYNLYRISNWPLFNNIEFNNTINTSNNESKIKECCIKQLNTVQPKLKRFLECELPALNDIVQLDIKDNSMKDGSVKLNYINNWSKVYTFGKDKYIILQGLEFNFLPNELDNLGITNNFKNKSDALFSTPAEQVEHQQKNVREINVQIIIVTRYNKEHGQPFISILKSKGVNLLTSLILKALENYLLIKISQFYFNPYMLNQINSLGLQIILNSSIEPFSILQLVYQFPNKYLSNHEIENVSISISFDQLVPIWKKIIYNKTNTNEDNGMQLMQLIDAHIKTSVGIYTSDLTLIKLANPLFVVSAMGKIKLHHGFPINLYLQTWASLCVLSI